MERSGLVMKTVSLWLVILLLASCARLDAGGDSLPSVLPSDPLPTETRAPSPTPAITLASATPTLTFTASPTAAPTSTPTPVPSPTSNPVTETAAPDTLYQPAGEATVPILLYHRVTDQTGSYRYAVTVSDFKAQMKLLAGQGYKTLTISELVSVIREGGNLPRKAVVITFDDGFLDVYENAFPVLQEYGFKATVYMITGVLETKLSYGYMQTPELQELAAAGWEIGSHSVSHSDLKTSTLGMGSELTKSRTDLESRLGIEVRTFAYPFAAANSWIEDQVEKQGYDSAVGVGAFNRHTLRSLYYLSRREVYHSTSLKGFEEFLLTK